jgi:hypothetical protein
MGSKGNDNDFLEQSKGKPVLQATLKLLFAVRKIRVANYKVESVRIEFSTPPKISIQTKVDGL